MAYTKQTWQDLPSKTTPINASRLGHIEQGIYDAASTADTAASDASSAISGLADKVDKVEGKGLSTNDFTDALKTKLDNIEAGAEVNVQSDWDQSDNSADDYIKNKPTLGTAASKNSTSVVTQSTDLVESGGVKDALGFGTKNLFDPSIISQTSTIIFSPVHVGSGEFTCSTTAPKNNNNSANLFLLEGNVQSGIDTSINGVWNGQTRTATAIDGYVTIVTRFVDGVNIANYNNQLEKGSTATAYEPYHVSVEQTLRDANLINGKNEADISDTDKTFTLLKSGERTRYIYLNKEISAGNKILSIKISNASNMTLALRYQLLYNNTQVTAGNVGSTNNGVYNLPVNISSAINRLYFFISDSDNNNATCNVSDLMISVEGGDYEPYYIPLKDVVPTKADNSVIAPVENGTTVQKTGGYAVGSHAIRNGQFITWKNAKAQGETINDASDYTSGDVASELRYGFQSITKNGLTIDCARFGKIIILTVSNGTNTEAYSANDAIVSLSEFTALFTTETFAIPSETLDTFAQTLRLYVGRNEQSLKVRANVGAGTVIRTTIVGYLN